MFGEQVAGTYGRVVLMTGPQRGGEKGGPVCRFILDARTGVLLDLGRIDCFAVEPHHHTQSPTMNPAVDSPNQKVRLLAGHDESLTLDQWRARAHQSITWLREEWLKELREFGWGAWVLAEVEAALPELVPAVEAFLLSHPPMLLQGAGQ